MKIAVIGDCQVRPNDDLTYLKRIGTYLAEKKPDVIVHIGDFADMSSLSSYDVGKKSFEGRRYKDDVEVTHEAMDTLLTPIWKVQSHQLINKKKMWRPQLVLTLGNHEDRINRAVNSDPKLDGTISVRDLNYEGFGWKVVPFLETIIINNVAFCHYFTSGVMGRPCNTARLTLLKMHMSCVAGHQQGRDIAYGRRADGTEITSIINGSCYEHDEDYLNPQTNTCWRGFYVLHDVVNGSFDEMAVSLKYLEKRYGS